jgi:hypothetical protein
MTETASLPRSLVIEQRLKVLEIEAAMQRTTLAATFSQWHQPRALTWAVEAAKFAGGMLKTPTARWLLTALVMRLIRGRG